MTKPTDLIKFVLPGPNPKSREGKVLSLVDPGQMPGPEILKKTRTHRIMFAFYPDMRSTRRETSYIVETKGFCGGRAKCKDQIWWVNKADILP